MIPNLINHPQVERKTQEKPTTPDGGGITVTELPIFRK